MLCTIEAHFQDIEAVLEEIQLPHVPAIGETMTFFSSDAETWLQMKVAEVDVHVHPWDQVPAQCHAFIVCDVIDDEVDYVTGNTLARCGFIVRRKIKGE